MILNLKIMGNHNYDAIKPNCIKQPFKTFSASYPVTCKNTNLVDFKTVQRSDNGNRASPIYLKSSIVK